MYFRHFANRVAGRLPACDINTTVGFQSSLFLAVLTMSPSVQLGSSCTDHLVSS